jgi:hypothetical protein
MKQLNKKQHVQTHFQQRGEESESEKPSPAKWQLRKYSIQLARQGNYIKMLT